MTRKLQFKEDGSFTILQFTDVHLSDCKKADLRTLSLMDGIVGMEKPDFVVFTGDTVYGKNNLELLKIALEPVIKHKIPFALVFGNHDCEIGHSKQELVSFLCENEFCVNEANTVGIHGATNFQIPIYSRKQDEPAWNLYFFDSGDYHSNEKIGGYDYIHRDQIDWYVRESIRHSSRYGALPELAFFHIPLPEYNEVWNTQICYGEKNEECCCPRQNSGLFSAMVEMENMKGIFVGHDHINDYFGELLDIKLCYGRATGYNTYGKEGFAHGARIIKLTEGQADFETWITLDHTEEKFESGKHMPDAAKRGDVS